MCNKVTIIIIQYCILKIHEEGRYLVFSSYTHTHTHMRWRICELSELQ